MTSYYFFRFINIGEGPSPEEVLTAIILNDQKVAFKSGYGKYVGYDKNGNVVGKADAIGPLEHWQPVFQAIFDRDINIRPCFYELYHFDLFVRMEN